MVRLRSGFAGLLLAAALAAPARAQAVDPGAAGFIASIGNQALQVIRSDMAPAQKLAFFDDVLGSDFDMPAIARFILGPYWRMASPDERHAFTALLADDLVRFYRHRFAEYHGERLQVTGSRPTPAGFLVTCRIIRPAGPPIAVDWQLSVEGGLYKVSDVIVDGVSMVLAERTQLAQEIARRGGIEGLLGEMRAPEVGSTVAPPPIR